MAKRKTRRPAAKARSARKGQPAARSAKRPAARQARPASSAPGRSAAKRPKPPARKKAAPKKAKMVAKTVQKAAARKKPAPKVVRKAAAPVAKKARTAAPPVVAKRPFLDRQRRTLEETVQTPPSSLDMDRHGSAARSGRAALESSLKEHTGMTPELTAGDVDGNWENAYFSGEEAPGGDNPTPDQNVVDDIGKALGLEYQDGEELKTGEKVDQRDEHRWELDPASAEDYKDRK